MPFNYMPPLSPPAKLRRRESGSSFEPDTNDDISSNGSGESLAFIKTPPAPTCERSIEYVYAAPPLRRSTRTASRSRSRRKSASRTPRPRSSVATVLLEVNNQPVSSSGPPPTVIPNTEGSAILSPKILTRNRRKLRKRDTVQYEPVSNPPQGADIQYNVPEVHTRGSTYSRKRRRDRKGSHQRQDYRSPLRSQSPPKSYSTSKPQERIAKLEKENTALEEENAILRTQVDELCSRLGEVGSNDLEMAIVKDDGFFENGFANLNKLVRDFVREFLQTRFSSPFSPSKVPIKIRGVLDSEGTDWQRYLKGGKNKMVLRAIAQKYISFYLVENIITDPIFRYNDQLRDALSTIQTMLKGNPSLCNRWRTRTIRDIRSTLTRSFFEDALVDLKSKELFKDTRVLWVKGQEAKEMERLKRITDYAMKLAIELHKLPHEIQYGLTRDDWDKLPRDIDTHPEKEFYQLNVHSRHSNFQFMTVFPGIRKLTEPSKPGEEESTGIVYLPLQLSAYVQVR
ncbi:hypothetical protein TWF281_011881 [Arthrobotrys megalospora]